MQERLWLQPAGQAAGAIERPFPAGHWLLRDRAKPLLDLVTGFVIDTGYPDVNDATGSLACYTMSNSVSDAAALRAGRRVRERGKTVKPGAVRSGLVGGDVSNS